jgi:hypothetical protein
MAFGAPDRLGPRGAVDAVMLLRQIEPDHPDRDRSGRAEAAPSCRSTWHPRTGRGCSGRADCRTRP